MVRGWWVASVLVLGACGDDSALTPDSAIDAPGDDGLPGGDGMPTSAVLAVDPTSIDFGTITIGDFSLITVTLSNSGDGVSGAVSASIVGTNADQFEVTTSCGMLDPGASCTLQVVARLTRGGAAAATLRIVSEPGGTIDVDLMASGVSLDDFLELDPGSYNLSLFVGETGPATLFTVTNIGTTTRGPLAVSVSGENADEVTITNDICTGVQLASEETCTFNVTMRPLSAGTHEATVTVTGGIPTQLSASINATVTTGLYVMGPTSRDFGSVGINQQSAASRVTVGNAAGITLGPLSTTFSSPELYAIADTCTGLTLAPSATCYLDVVAKPAAFGPRPGNLVLEATPGGQATVALAVVGISDGGGFITANPSVGDFGPVSVGVPSAPFVFSITNAGASPTAVLATTITGMHASDFAIAETTCTAPLNFGSSCTVSVVFTPGAAGDRQAVVTTTGNPGGTVSSALGGTGVSPHPRRLP